MKNQLSILILFIFVLLFTQCSSDQKTIEDLNQNRVIKENATEVQEEVVSLQTGNYGDLLLAFDGNQVTGFYNLVTGNGQFGCAFYFHGKTKGKKGEIPIQWYFPGEKIQQKGKLTISKGEVQLKVIGNPGGQCMPELLGEGQIIRLDGESNWQSIRVVKLKKSTIYEEADDAMESGMHFKKGDVVCVLESKGSWLRAELPGGEKVGWIKSNDLEIL